MGRFFTNLRRNKTHVEIYVDGEMIAKVKVSENNVGSRATIDFEASDRVRYKIIKTDTPNFGALADDSFFNKEEFNK